MSRILLIDDSSFQRRILFGILQQLGYEVDTACNGQDALEKIQAHPPDCLLLDMLMPIMNGVQLLEHMESQGGDVTGYCSDRRCTGFVERSLSRTRGHHMFEQANERS